MPLKRDACARARGPKAPRWTGNEMRTHDFFMWIIGYTATAQKKNQISKFSYGLLMFWMKNKHESNERDDNNIKWKNCICKSDILSIFILRLLLLGSFKYIRDFGKQQKQLISPFHERYFFLFAVQLKTASIRYILFVLVVNGCKWSKWMLRNASAQQSLHEENKSDVWKRSARTNWNFGKMSAFEADS